MKLHSAYGEEHGDALEFSFTGTVTGDEIAGTLDMGEYLSAKLDREEARRRAELTGDRLDRRRNPGRDRRFPRVPRAEPKYDLLLRGGHVVDSRNGVSAVRDVAIAAGTIAAVESRIDPADAFKVVDVSGLYVTPGLIDIHTHVFAGTGEKGSYAGDNSVYPDGFTLRVGVTTIADAGCAGWRNFDDFKAKVIDRAITRVLVFLNIVGNGMRGGTFEDDLADMEVQADRRHGSSATATSSSASRPRITRDPSGHRSSARSRLARWPMYP